MRNHGVDRTLSAVSTDMSNSVYQCDGNLHEVTSDDLRRGNVLRPIQSEPGAVYSFADSIIVDVFFRDPNGNQLSIVDHVKVLDKRLCVKLARPYAYVSGVDTTCPAVLTGVEHLELYASRLIGPDARYRLVVKSNGKASNHIT